MKVGLVALELGVQGKLRDAEHVKALLRDAGGPRLALVVVPQARGQDLARDVLQVVGRVVGGDADQHAEAGPDGRDHGAVHRHAGAQHPLDHRPHGWGGGGGGLQGRRKAGSKERRKEESGKEEGRMKKEKERKRKKKKEEERKGKKKKEKERKRKKKKEGAMCAQMRDDDQEEQTRKIKEEETGTRRARGRRATEVCKHIGAEERKHPHSSSSSVQQQQPAIHVSSSTRARRKWSSGSA